MITGACVLPVQPGHDLAALAEDAYRQVFAIVAGRSGMRLYRMWNYVPSINQSCGGLENYRRFNVGRWNAFQERYGTAAEPSMPAATAVGISEPVLVIQFHAGSNPVRYVENPEQVPAYAYPEQHGPRPPSFSRGAVIPEARTAYLSGTASVKGHRTIASDCLEEQVRLTLDNVSIVKKRLVGLVPETSLRSTWRVYVRHREEAPVVVRLLEDALGISENQLLALEAAICRESLRVEVEGEFRW